MRRLLPAATASGLALALLAPAVAAPAGAAAGRGAVVVPADATPASTAPQVEPTRVPTTSRGDDLVRLPDNAPRRSTAPTSTTAARRLEPAPRPAAPPDTTAPVSLPRPTEPPRTAPPDTEVVVVEPGLPAPSDDGGSHGGADTTVATTSDPPGPHGPVTRAPRSTSTTRPSVHGDRARRGTSGRAGPPAADRPELPTSPPATPVPLPAAVPSADWTVRPGDHLWGIAEALLVDATGGPVSDAAVVPYWQRLVEQNRPRLVDPDNPDLILVGQVLVLPPVELR